METVNCTSLKKELNSSCYWPLLLLARVVSSEISGKNFQKSFSNFPGNLLKNFFHFIRFCYDHMHLLIVHLQRFNFYKMSNKLLVTRAHIDV